MMDIKHYLDTHICPTCKTNEGLWHDWWWYEDSDGDSWDDERYDIWPCDNCCELVDPIHKRYKTKLYYKRKKRESRGVIKVCGLTG